MYMKMMDARRRNTPVRIWREAGNGLEFLPSEGSRLGLGVNDARGVAEGAGVAVAVSAGSGVSFSS